MNMANEIELLIEAIPGRDQFLLRVQMSCRLRLQLLAQLRQLFVGRSVQERRTRAKSAVVYAWN